MGWIWELISGPITPDKFNLMLGLLFAAFTFWRQSCIVRALNNVEKQARDEILDATRKASYTAGQVDVLVKLYKDS